MLGFMQFARAVGAFRLVRKIFLFSLHLGINLYFGRNRHFLTGRRGGLEPSKKVRREPMDKHQTDDNHEKRNEDDVQFIYAVEGSNRPKLGREASNTGGRSG